MLRLCTGACTITGWGRTRQGGSTSPVLREAAVPLISQKDCKQNYRPELITSNMICAGFSGGGIDACQGDSGGKCEVPGRPTVLSVYNVTSLRILSVFIAKFYLCL